MANAIEKNTNTEKKTAKRNGKQLPIAPLADSPLMQILQIVDSVKNGAAIEGIVDSAKADKAMGVKVGTPCLMGLLTKYDGGARSMTIRAIFGDKVMEYTVANTGNQDVPYLVKDKKTGEAARGYDETFLRRVRNVVRDEGQYLICLSYFGQIRTLSFDALGVFFQKEKKDFVKLFGQAKYDKMFKLAEAKVDFSFSYQDCEDVLKYVKRLNDIVKNEEGTYSPEYVKQAQNRLAEIAPPKVTTDNANTSEKVV